MKFAIGAIVVEKKDLRAHTSYNTQKVVGYLDGALLLQHHGFAFEGEITEESFDFDKPGSRTWREGIRRFQENEVFTPEEALAEIRRLEEAKAKLEGEFDSVVEQVRGKMEQAAALTSEAADILVKHKKTFDDVLEEGVSLYKAQKKGGWRHSTFQCKVG